MSKKEYTPPVPSLRWFLVEKKETIGGGRYRKVYTIQARSSIKAIQIALDQPSDYVYSNVVSVRVSERDIIVLAHGEEEKEDKQS